ncbi:hypothetical protein J537_3704 [Acinetobacter baumannii 1437282]|nr:hypothetical protein ACINWC323_0071 [Acinetobacter sp. WC-323]EXB23774.1 hypothetical protein J537_3704 [Acinetobacter baumannii 1437282]
MLEKKLRTSLVLRYTKALMLWFAQVADDVVEYLISENVLSLNLA